MGYKITINKKILLFIPDIDKWEKWETNITELIKKVDYAFLDATFYKNGELKRDMSEIPHPFVEESMELFSTLTETDKQKVHFIHFNHTNPLLIKGSAAQKEVFEKGDDSNVDFSKPISGRIRKEILDRGCEWKIKKVKINFY